MKKWGDLDCQPEITDGFAKPRKKKKKCVFEALGDQDNLVSQGVELVY